MHCRSTVLTKRTPRNWIAWHGPRILCGAHASPSSRRSSSNRASPTRVCSRLSPRMR